MKASGQVQAPSTLPLAPQISRRYSLHIWLGGSGLHNLKHRKNLLPSLVIEPQFFGCQACSLVTVQTRLFILPTTTTTAAAK